MKAGKGLLSYALYSENALHSVSLDSGSINSAWGTTGTPNINYGDSYRSIVGKVVDVRYYPRGLEAADFTQLFTQRKAVCVRSCQVCIDLVTCSQCTAGYYLSGGTCLRCFMGCATCSGAGETQCISCSAGYTLSTSSCMSK